MADSCDSSYAFSDITTDEEFSRESISDYQHSISGSSTEVSIGSTSRSNSNEEAVKEFMRKYVSDLFNPLSDITVDDKRLFGELCQTEAGREHFARYVNLQRCESQCVDESTFCKLTHAFALVLFECYEADDFAPSKHLMNMAFTFYHVPKACLWELNQPKTDTFELSSLDSPTAAEYAENLFYAAELENAEKCATSSANKVPCSEKKSIHPLWKSANNWLDKQISLHKNLFINGSPVDKGEQKPTDNRVTTESDIEDNKPSPCLPLKLAVSPKTKVYLYEPLKNQVIWKSLRFWNAAFFDAVNSERQLHCSTIGWNLLSPEEREQASEEIRNITFGQLGTFVNNMKHLGIGQKTCLEFMQKQSVIGLLSKDHYDVLHAEISKPLVGH